jgi:hypothetical protein
MMDRASAPARRWRQVQALLVFRDPCGIVNRSMRLLVPLVTPIPPFRRIHTVYLLLISIDQTLQLTPRAHQGRQSRFKVDFRPSHVMPAVVVLEALGPHERQEIVGFSNCVELDVRSPHIWVGEGMVTRIRGSVFGSDEIEIVTDIVPPRSARECSCNMCEYDSGESYSHERLLQASRPRTSRCRPSSVV